MSRFTTLFPRRFECAVHRLTQRGLVVSATPRTGWDYGDDKFAIRRGALEVCPLGMLIEGRSILGGFWSVLGRAFGDRSFEDHLSSFYESWAMDMDASDYADEERLFAFHLGRYFRSKYAPASKRLGYDAELLRRFGVESNLTLYYQLNR